MILQTHAEVPSHRTLAAVRQDRPEQQGLLGEHAWPLAEHVAPGWQVPVVDPRGTSQRRPRQQSDPEVHAPPCGWHVCGAWQVPPEQMPEQHCVPVEHWAPLAEHVPPPVPASVPPSVEGVPPSVEGVPPSDPPPVDGTWQALVSSEVARHWVPGQHVTPPWSQRVPTGAQVGDWHLSPPSVAGRHRAPPQH
jgi:hypothetical protein